MSVFLTEIKIKGYRSCRNVVFTPQPDLSTLIGLNGSGKTNILLGILLLKKVFRFKRTPEIDDQNLSSTPCQIAVKFSVDGAIVLYSAQLEIATTAQNTDEIVSAAEKWDFSTLNVSNQEKVLSVSETEKLHGIIIKKCSIYLSTMKYYSASQFTDPTRCPSAFEIDSEGRLVSAFSDNNRHGKFLYDLYDTKENRSAQYATFTSLIGKDGLNLAEELNFMKFDLASSAIKALGSAKIFETINSNIVIIPRVTKGRSSLSFSQLSEGTFKSIALLFYLITDQSNLLLIEEPEVCVHHGLLNHLIATIKAFSNQKQIIFSTHSDFVLDSLKPENVFLVKNSEKQGTTVKSIAKALSKQNFKALKEYLATEGNLGDYWRSGGIDA